MKTKKLILFLLMCNHWTFAQIVTFQKTIFDIPYKCDTCIPSEPYAIINDIKETYDHGFIATGITNTAFLLKFDNNGDTMWLRYFPNNGSIVGYSVLQTCDSGYISCGYSINKTDKNGNIIWSKYYPDASSSGYGYPGRIALTNDCGYIYASSTDSLGTGGYDMYIVKTDSGGNPLWSRTYGGSGDDEATSVQQTADGGYIIAGFTNSFDTSGYRAYLIKTDSNGDTLWTKTYGPNFSGGSIISALQTYDHGYIISGAAFIKTDSLGNVMWAKNQGGSQPTADSGYIFQGGGPYDVMLIKANSVGNILWARDFPGPNYNGGFRSGNSVLQTSDGGYIETDHTQITVHFDEQVYTNLNKTDANGHSGCGEIDTTFTIDSISITASGTATIVTSPTTIVMDFGVTAGNGDSISIGTACTNVGIPEQRTENSLTIYPNPVTPDGCISIFLNEDMNGAKITIFNTLGEVLYSEVVNGTGQMILLQLKGKLSTGMYFVRIKQGDNICVQKIVVMG